MEALELAKRLKKVKKDASERRLYVQEARQQEQTLAKVEDNSAAKLLRTRHRGLRTSLPDGTGAATQETHQVSQQTHPQPRSSGKRASEGAAVAVQRPKWVGQYGKAPVPALDRPRASGGFPKVAPPVRTPLQPWRLHLNRLGLGLDYQKSSGDTINNPLAKSTTRPAAAAKPASPAAASTRGGPPAAPTPRRLGYSSGLNWSTVPTIDLGPSAAPLPDTERPPSSALSVPPRRPLERTTSELAQGPAAQPRTSLFRSASDMSSIKLSLGTDVGLSVSKDAPPIVRQAATRATLSRTQSIPSSAADPIILSTPKAAPTVRKSLTGLGPLPSVSRSVSTTHLTVPTPFPAPGPLLALARAAAAATPATPAPRHLSDNGTPWAAAAGFPRNSGGVATLSVIRAADVSSSLSDSQGLVAEIYGALGRAEATLDLRPDLPPPAAEASPGFLVAKILRSLADVASFIPLDQEPPKKTTLKIRGHGHQNFASIRTNEPAADSSYEIAPAALDDRRVRGSGGGGAKPAPSAARSAGSLSTAGSDRLNPHPLPATAKSQQYMYARGAPPPLSPVESAKSSSTPGTPTGLNPRSSAAAAAADGPKGPSSQRRRSSRSHGGGEADARAPQPRREASDSSLTGSSSKKAAGGRAASVAVSDGSAHGTYRANARAGGADGVYRLAGAPIRA